MDRTTCQVFLQNLLSLSKADETFIVFTSSEGTSMSMGANRVLPASHVSDWTVQVTVRAGAHYATVSSGRVDAASLRSLMDRAVDMAAHLPEVGEVVPFPSPVDVLEAPLFKQANTDISDLWRVDVTGKSLEMAGNRGLMLTGRISTGQTATAVAGSNGLFLYQPASQVHLQVRVCTPDGRSAGFAEQRAQDVGEIRLEGTVQQAIDKCLAWKDPVQIKAERLTTVFEPRALAEMLVPFIQQFDEQAIRENRSFLRKLDGTSREGMELFVKGFSIWSDPYHPGLPSMPFSMEGLPIKPVQWIRDGVIETVARSRFLALENQRPPVPFPSNLLVTGLTGSLDEVIQATTRGLLVSGFSTLSVEDPANCLLTGSTRDGLFLIEDGRIVRGVQNLLIRETPVYLFKRMEHVGAQMKTHPRNVTFPMSLPPIRVTDVMYTRHTGVV